MDHIRRVFNHCDKVTTECKSFVKSHEKQMTNAEIELAAVRRCVENMNGNLVQVSPGALNSTSYRALKRSIECNKTCQTILKLENKFSARDIETGENPDQKHVYNILEAQAGGINAAFHLECNRLKSMYEQLKVHSIVSAVE